MPKWLITGLIIVGYVLVIVLGIIWGHAYDSLHLREQLQWASPLMLEINFYLLLAGTGDQS